MLQPRPSLSAPTLPLPGGISPGLLRARVHELCGPSRVALTLMLLEGCTGEVIWVMPAWLPERPYPCGVRDFIHPGRLIFARARRPEDIQWAGEEALRSGAASVVVLEMPGTPGLTAVRRLHLAAETGAGAAHHAARPAPVGLILSVGDGGAQGVESRWHMAPTPAPSGLLDAGASWCLTRTRARTAPVAAWSLLRDHRGHVSALPSAGADHGNMPAPPHS